MGKKLSSAQQSILSNSALTLGEDLRNHPSVFSFQWSDSRRFGGEGRPVRLGAAERRYDTTHVDTSDSSQTNAGGSWGYDSEESAGDTVPTIDSLDRFLSAADLSNLWQNPSTNQFHLTTRAQFEAFIDHAGNSPLPSTGTIYWQLNKGWPSMLWTLYNFDGDQSGSYFGVQEADKTGHALCALDNATVTLDNLGGTAQPGLSVESKVFSLSGSLLDDQTASNLSLASQQVMNNVLTPKVPAATAPSATASVYFVELLLRNASAVSVSATTAQQPGPAGADLATTITLTDTSSSAVAFFLRADVRRGTAAGVPLSGDNELQSSIWQGNDITLFPARARR